MEGCGAAPDWLRLLKVKCQEQCDMISELPPVSAPLKHLQSERGRDEILGRTSDKLDTWDFKWKIKIPQVM